MHAIMIIYIRRQYSIESSYELLFLIFHINNSESISTLIVPHLLDFYIWSSLTYRLYLNTLLQLVLNKYVLKFSLCGFFSSYFNPFPVNFNMVKQTVLRRPDSEGSSLAPI